MRSVCAEAGPISGIARGLIFGMLMGVMGMLALIASMVGSNAPSVGFAIQMTMSVVIGMGLTVPFGNRLLTGYLRGAVVEIVYGVIRWILGLLLAIPMIFGMPPFSVNATTLACLMGRML